MFKLISSPVDQWRPMEGLKDTYGFIETSKVLKVFEGRGWQIAKTSIAPTRTVKRQGFQRHLLILENPSQFPVIPGLTNENAARPQLCLLNSHDGTTAFRLFIGLLRFACMNGLVSGTSLRDFKAVHSKNVLSRLSEGIDFLSNNMSELFSQVQALQSVNFTPEMIAELTKRLVDARLENVNKVVQVSYRLPAQRMEDVNLDGFTVLNRIQEYLVRGGISYTHTLDRKDEKGNIVNTSIVSTNTRRLSSLQGQIRLNRTAWDAAMQVAGLVKPTLKAA
jgi:hypothetical protein